eukprot:GHRR01022836.1.p1 GENE.GHRR01022836.1~~GHRR01022836.1.p1  ORF type:complete len:126 (-),score=33.40 GHRR01022836.1:666-1043(-)
MPCHSPDCFGLCNRRPPVVIGKAMGPKAHVLVCAPSNAALDEVVLRILQHGLLDGSGKRYDPSIVRIGVNVHHSVKAVSLEMLVDAKLGVTEKVGMQLTTLGNVTSSNTNSVQLFRQPRSRHRSC